MTEPSFQGVNRLIVLLFEDNAVRKGDTKYFPQKVEIKNYNVMIDGCNLFFEQPVKNEIKTYENIGKIAAGEGVGYKNGLVAFVIILDYS